MDSNTNEPREGSQRGDKSRQIGGKGQNHKFHQRRRPNDSAQYEESSPNGSITVKPGRYDLPPSADSDGGAIIRSGDRKEPRQQDERRPRQQSRKGRSRARRIRTAARTSRKSRSRSVRTVLSSPYSLCVLLIRNRRTGRSVPAAADRRIITVSARTRSERMHRRQRRIPLRRITRRSA